jgi:hypothetical protein
MVSLVAQAGLEFSILLFNLLSAEIAGAWYQFQLRILFLKSLKSNEIIEYVVFPPLGILTVKL